MHESNNQNGFTIIEVLFAMLIFAIGMLAVATMQITSIEGGTQANIRTESTSVASAKLEELMFLPFADPLLLDTDGDGTGQDIILPVDNLDDDGGGFGLLDEDAASDFQRYLIGNKGNFQEVPVGTPGIVYSIFWNVANILPAPPAPLVLPVVAGNETSKRISVIVRWTDLTKVTTTDNGVRRVILNASKSAVGG